MNTLSVAIAVVSGLIASAVSTAVAVAAGLDGAETRDAEEDGVAQSHGHTDLSALTRLPEYGGVGSSNTGAVARRMPASGGIPLSFSDHQGAGASENRRLGLWGNTAAFLRVQSLPSSAAAVSFIQEQTGIDARSLVSSNQWLGAGNGVAQTVVVGHTWRDLTFEGAAFYSDDEGRATPDRQESLRIDSRSARLSFSPTTNWSVRLSRGTVSGLDHFVAGDEVRRTALSATYRRSFASGDWEATLAYGRNARKFRESTVGYLAESAFRFNGVHTLFGRIEQVGSDEISRENEALQRHLFKMNKLTLGYSQDLRITASLKLDTGAFVTRHFVPPGMAASYGDGPTAYMVFVRVKLQ